MPSTTNVPTSLPYLINRIEYWEEQLIDTNSTHLVETCATVITELELVVAYAKSHS